MQLWVGLGNPGASYAQHRHNAGFMAVEALAESYCAAPWSKKFNALLTEISVSLPSEQVRGGVAGGGSEAVGVKTPVKIILLKPQQYMNRSGQAVGEAMRFYKLTPADITVFHDELDLPLGKLKVKTGGGHGGHNGLRDIDAHIGKEYRRVRLGIGHPGDKDLVTDYVLSNFSGAEAKAFRQWMEALATAAPLLAAGQDAGFMTKLAL
jgi:peptidyl-tRNA hydrolase, PTH1 family